MGYMEAPPVYPDEIWDPEREAGFWAAESAERQFATGGAWDSQAANPVLAMTVSRTAEGELSGLSDNELLGAITANERVAGHHAWVANRLAAEFAKRKLEWDPQLQKEVIPEFGEEDYRQEIVVSGMTARQSLTRSVTLDQMPECMRLAHDGALTDYRQRIIAEEAGVLDPVLLGKADELIARDAEGRTPLSLRNLCKKIVMKLDPLAAEERRKKGNRGRRVEFWSDQSGNVTMAAREMSVAVAAAIKQALTGWAQIMRKAGIKGSMDNLRHDAATALLMGRHPVSGQVPAQAPEPKTGTAEADPFNPWGFGDSFEPGMESDEPPVPGNPIVNINLHISAGTLDPKIDAPGFIPELGVNVTGKVARDLIIAGSANAASRWCITEVDPETGYAVAHGCARGRHPWPRPSNNPTGNDPPGRWPGEPGAQPGPEVAEFIAGLGVTMERLATEPGEDGRTEPQHDPSRKLRHMIEARNATCATPGCDHPAVTSDMEHRVEYENGGKTSEGNLDPATHGHCHRLKQNERWQVIKTGPRETVWIGPSGRKRVVRPTRYLIM
jgi:hypothetical protein